jgi:signal transduction histidine kinase/BarA-like signal transduction histidine kinase
VLSGNLQIKKLSHYFLITILWCLCVGVLAFFSVDVSAQSAETVKVGYYFSNNFQEGMDDRAPKSGYSYEYLQKLASYTGWKYEYVYGEWDELFEKLKDGEIDLMAGVAYSEDRVDQIGYPDSEMLNETFYIYKDTDDSSMQCGDIASYSGKKIGTLKGDQRMTAALEQWKARHRADIEIEYYSDFTECARVFNEQQIDGFVSADNVVSSYSGITPVEKIGKQLFYLCTAKEREDLLSELNMAMSIMNERDAVEVDELRNKYYTETTVSVFLSQQEQQWMKEHAQITVGYLADYLPYCDKAEDGSATGLVSDIVPDLFDALSGDYDPEIIYRCFDDQQEMLDCLKNGEVDFVMPVSDGKWYAEQEEFVQSSAVVAFPIALVYREPYDNEVTSRIAVNQNNLRQYWYTLANYPDAEIVMYDGIEACIDAVNSGEADSTLLSALRVSQLLNGEKKLNIITLSDSEKLCFGVAAGNKALLQILNHGLSILGESYGLNHTYRYLDTVVTYTLTDVIQDHVWLFIGLLTVLLILIVTYFIHREQEQKKAAQHELKQKELLEKALCAAKQASVAKKVFLQNMSHDIRTPMNAVLGFTNLAIQAGGDTEKTQDYLSKIKISGNHLLGIVNEVLEISRIESGQTKLDESVWSIADIVRETDIIIRDQALAKKQEFSIDIWQVQDMYIYCDKLRVKEILVNLLGNAVKYTQTGGSISLRIIQKPCEKENFGNYEIHVKDNGCGMSEEFLQKIFEPFERQANSTISGIQGTGLGMTIIKGFVDAMGGTIDIKSEENKGTEIIVRLCQRIVEAPEKSEEQKTISCSPELFVGKRVLLVEDNSMNREIATAILEEAGFKVDTAENGAIAVEKVTYYPEGFYDVILMDIQMPVMDGYTATRKIRSLENKAIAKIPIITVSANAFDEDRQTSLEAGMNGHLVKPIVVDELLEVLGGILE